ncbi:MAG: nucleoside phosphorylase domain-containing protein [Monoraphidium minutum]|nr:MAG: nucleoside phosphorylase domain-containing protein [Monoraphidium minutum]
MPPIREVILIFAMEVEAMPAVKRLGLVRDEPHVTPGPAPCVTFSGAYAGLTLHAVWTGRDAAYGVDHVGTVPASLAAYVSLQAWPGTDLVISAGTAGGFRSQGAAIGDVFVSTGKMHHDRRIPLPGFDKYGIGFIESVPTPNMCAALGLKAGIVSTGDSLDAVEADMAIMVEHGVAVKEMEAGSVAWVAALFGKPALCIKAITDIVDGGRPAADEFQEHLNTAAAAIQATLPRVAEFLGGRALDEL